MLSSTGGYLGFICTEGVGVGAYSGGGRELRAPAPLVDLTLIARLD